MSHPSQPAADARPAHPHDPANIYVTPYKKSAMYGVLYMAFAVFPSLPALFIGFLRNGWWYMIAGIFVLWYPFCFFRDNYQNPHYPNRKAWAEFLAIVAGYAIGSAALLGAMERWLPLFVP